MVGRQGGSGASAAAEHGSAVAHVGDVELAILHQRRCRARTTSRALHVMYQLSVHFCTNVYKERATVKMLILAKRSF